MLHHGSVRASLNQNKKNLKKPKTLTLTLTLNVLLPSIAFHFYDLFTTYLLYEEVMSVRLYDGFD